MEENTLEFLTKTDLEELFNKYFLTLEEKQKIEEENKKLENELLELKEQEELKALEEKELISLTDEEFRNTIISEIKDIKDYSKFSNNLFYTFLVLGGTILICTFIYKTLQKFY